MPFENLAHFHLAEQQLIRRQQQSSVQWQRRALAEDEFLSPRIEAPYAQLIVEDHRSVPPRPLGGSSSHAPAGAPTPRDAPNAHFAADMGFYSSRGMSNSLMKAGLSTLGSHEKSAPETFKGPAKKVLLPEDLSMNDLNPCSPQVARLKVRDLGTDGRALGFVYPSAKGHERKTVLDARDLPPLSEVNLWRPTALSAATYRTTRGVI